jgi:hypothetical protein
MSWRTYVVAKLKGVAGFFTLRARAAWIAVRNAAAVRPPASTVNRSGTLEIRGGIHRVLRSAKSGRIMKNCPQYRMKYGHPAVSRPAKASSK